MFALSTVSKTKFAHASSYARKLNGALTSHKHGNEMCDDSFKDDANL